MNNVVSPVFADLGIAGKEAGYVQEQLQQMKLFFRLMTAEEVESLPPIQWMIKGVLPRTGIGQMYGPSKSGKSFLAWDMAAHIAEGKDWFGYRVKQADVVYVVLEGAGGFPNRLKAYRKFTGRPAPKNLYIVMDHVSLDDPAHIEALAEACPKGALIIIDTQNASCPHANENASDDMGAILDGAKRLADLVQGFCLMITHTGKDEARGARGHSSQGAACDMTIKVERKGNLRSFIVEKVKDGRDNMCHPFDLEIVDLGLDADGDMMTSCVAVPVERTKDMSGQNVKLSVGAQYCLESLKRVLADKKVNRIHRDEWRPAFISEHWGNTTNAKDKAFSRNREKLVQLGLITVENDYYALPEYVNDSQASVKGFEDKGQGQDKDRTST